MPFGLKSRIRMKIIYPKISAQAKEIYPAARLSMIPMMKAEKKAPRMDPNPPRATAT